MKYSLERGKVIVGSMAWEEDGLCLLGAGALFLGNRIFGFSLSVSNYITTSIRDGSGGGIG